MNSIRLATIFLGAFCVALLPAQTVTQPGERSTGQSASFSQPAMLDSASPASLRSSVVEIETPHDRAMRHLWIASMVSAAAASGLDAGTSWGKREGNALLASPDGTFGARGLSIKAGMIAAVLVPQIVFRKHKELRTKFVIGNFAEAGIFTGVAIHNFGVTNPH